MGRFLYLNRPTVVLPGSHGAVSGTAINDWIDENGESKFANGSATASEESSSPE